MGITFAEQLDALVDLDSSEYRLTDWEVDFVASCDRRRHEDGLSLTAKQCEIIGRIYDDCFIHGKRAHGWAHPPMTPSPELRTDEPGPNVEEYPEREVRPVECEEGGREPILFIVLLALAYVVLLCAVLAVLLAIGVLVPGSK